MSRGYVLAVTASKWEFGHDAWTEFLQSPAELASAAAIAATAKLLRERTKRRRIAKKTPAANVPVSRVRRGLKKRTPFTLKRMRVGSTPREPKP